MSELFSKEESIPVEQGFSSKTEVLDELFKTLERDYRSLAQQEEGLLRKIDDELQQEDSPENRAMLSFLQNNLDVLRAHREEIDRNFNALMERMEALREHNVRIEEKKN